MSGLTKKKSYTMREMKMIVDYVIDQKAYSEIKGRKMWVNFANSNLTTRTWQSLKETFLKRILPDIHNPYYKLNMDQVRSFRQGCDVTMTDKNKLTDRIEGDESSSNADNPKENDQPTTSKHTEDAPPGEDKVASKISSHDRSSVETVLIEKCYETTEDLRKELESPDLDNIEKENESVSGRSPTKSLRDCITYSEPLTPMLAEVLHDFATDEESSDPDQLKIIIDDSSENKDQHDDPKPTEQSIVGAVEKMQNENSNKDIENLEASEVVDALLNDNLDKKEKTRSKTLQLKKSQTKTKDNIAVSEQKGKYDKYDVVEKKNCESTKNNVENLDAQKLNNNAQNTSSEISSTKDSLLPNNQEELNTNATMICTNDTGNIDKNSTHESLDVKVSAESKTKITKKRKISSEKINFEPKQQDDSEKLTFNSHVENGEIVTPTKNDLTSKDDMNFERKLDSRLPNKTSIEEPKKTNDAVNNSPSPTATKKNVEVNASQINPCLQSVSLYAEQFSTKKYTDSESEDVNPTTVQNPKANNDVTKMAVNVVNEVVILKSHSESENEDQHVKTANNSPMKRHATKPEKDRALANLFGFSNGGVAPSRKRRMSKRTSFQRVSRHNVSTSETSDWTSASDSDYVSPPRGGKSKHKRKYMKPRSARILSLEEEGGLFVVHGKKIYPLIKDGKILKSYLTYLPDSDPEEEESHWKLKYIQERKKAEELKKLLEEAKVNSDKLAEERSKSPILLPSTPKSKAVPQNTREQRRESIGSVKNNVAPKPADVISEQKTVKIKFTKQDEELQLEGHWSQIHSVLEQVVQVFQKDSEPKVNGTNAKLQPKAQPENLYSRGSTPTVDPETREKVNQIETEIFKEIEEMDKMEKVELASAEVVEPNVTVRKRGRPTKLSLAMSPQNSSKKLKIDDDKESTSLESIDKTLLNVPKTQAKRSPRSPRIMPEDIKNKNDVRKSGRRPKQLPQDEKKAEFEDSSNILYKFPSPEPTVKRSAGASRIAKKGTSNRYMQSGIIITSPDTLSVDSINTSQGYQDSDMSPLKVNKKAKRKVSLPTMLNRERNRLNRKIRRVANLSLSRDTAGPNVSFNNLPLMTGNSSTLNSDAYRSESYQLLIPKTKHSFRQLEKIDENNPALSYIDSNDSREVSEYSPNVDNKCTNKGKMSANSSQGSSNMSPPHSPELSIVENISISKNDVANVGDAPTINEICANDIQVNNKYKKYSISKVDVSMPLMEQECDLRMSYRMDMLNNETFLKSSEASSQDITSENKVTTVTESLLNKMLTVKIEGASSSSDSLDEKLKEMLLESAKKIIVQKQVNENEVSKKAKTKKRSSTPLKKKNTTKSVGTKVQTVVEEECMEYCSYGGNKPNQSSVLYETVHKKRNSEEAISVTSTKDSKPIEKGRRKKDVIKVKITKPKEKVAKSQKRSTKSTCDDSGINVESAVCPNGSIDSVELIHNHSETCLKANECMGESVEIINFLEKSNISMNSKSLPSSIGMSEHQQQTTSTADNAILTELFCNNAQDTSTLNNLATNINDDGGDHKGNGDDYDTAVSLTSLMTEDLSDEPPTDPPKPTKWYLLSDEETNNTNLNDPNFHFTGSFGSKLDQIFPITCAVPNLSAITEQSRETDNSCKPKAEVESDTGNDLNSRKWKRNIEEEKKLNYVYPQNEEDTICFVNQKQPIVRKFLMLNGDLLERRWDLLDFED